MRASFAALNSQRGVEEKNALFCPAREITIPKWRPSVIDLSENDFERCRKAPRSDIRKGQSMGVARRRIRILTENNHGHAFEWCQGQGSKDVFGRGQNQCA